MLWVFFGAVTCVLLIGVANLVSLQLVRNAGRERELGLRAALGASRWRLIRQLLVESLLLSLVGGAGGLLAASNGVRLVTAALPADFPRAGQIALDSAVWVFAALVSALVGVTIGLIPALRSIQPRLMKRVNEGAWSATLSHRRARIQRVLIAFEAAMALVLLVGAGLLINSFGRLISEDAGMRERDLWVVAGTLPMRYRPPADSEFWLSALRTVRALPDVESASLVVNDGGPLDGFDILRAESFRRARPHRRAADSASVTAVSAAATSAPWAFRLSPGGRFSTPIPPGPKASSSSTGQRPPRSGLARIRWVDASAASVGR